MALLNTPTQLNGYPVTRVEQHKSCATVMVEKPGEYVVATWWPELGETWSWGHYFPTEHGDLGAFNEAREEFNATATRNAKR